MSQVKTETIHFQLEMQVKYDEYSGQDQSGANRTLVLLHGYSEAKERMFRKLGQHLLHRCKRMLILNAPFPAPPLIRDEYKEGYAWYFRSIRKNLTMIAPTQCQTLFDAFIKSSGLDPSREAITLIGYSQGGFILPYLAERLQSVERLICLSAGAHLRRWAFKSNYPVTFVHGTEDTSVALADCQAQARAAFATMPGIDFQTFAGGHDISADSIALIDRVLSSTPLSQNEIG